MVWSCTDRDAGPGRVAVNASGVTSLAHDIAQGVLVDPEGAQQQLDREGPPAAARMAQCAVCAGTTLAAAMASPRRSRSGILISQTG